MRILYLCDTDNSLLEAERQSFVIDGDTTNHVSNFFISNFGVANDVVVYRLPYNLYDL